MVLPNEIPDATGQSDTRRRRLPRLRPDPRLVAPSSLVAHRAHSVSIARASLRSQAQHNAAQRLLLSPSSQGAIAHHTVGLLPRHNESAGIANMTPPSTPQEKSPPAPAPAAKKEKNFTTLETLVFPGVPLAKTFDHWSILNPSKNLVQEAPKLPGCGPWEMPLPPNMDVKIFIEPYLAQLSRMLNVHIVACNSPNMLSVDLSPAQRAEPQFVEEHIACRWKAWKLLFDWVKHLELRGQAHSLPPSDILAFVLWSIMREGLQARDLAVEEIEQRCQNRPMFYESSVWQLPTEPQVAAPNPSFEKAEFEEPSFPPEDSEGPRLGAISRKMSPDWYEKQLATLHEKYPQKSYVNKTSSSGMPMRLPDLIPKTGQTEKHKFVMDVRNDSRDEYQTKRPRK
ncbi:hypothetical protein CTRI78_v005067 [Colletotrichum trifolii]|uniref:Uncharacterized protein n=1 Tax=Colletotrichum trifolii TaxID=5466 RepID=A0A4R8RFK9_COLTR|nr:hypothetical protein CTRI78_v005067 [Colletotrichum trifolii]